MAGATPRGGGGISRSGTTSPTSDLSGHEAPGGWSRATSHAESPLPAVVEAEVWDWGAGAARSRQPSEMHPVVRAAREQHIKTSLVVGHISKSPTLKEHFQKYSLRDFFDQRGQRLYQNLSMSVAAKTNAEIGGAFGSDCATDASKSVAAPRKLSAKAYRLATEVVQKDREALKQKSAEQYRCLDETEKVKKQEVHTRLEEMLLIEIPGGAQYLPPGCTVRSILPPDTTRTQEREDRRRFDKMNRDLLEGGFQCLHNIQAQKWVLAYDEIVEVVASAAAWGAATGLTSPLGVDRPTFCQLLLDLGLSDQRRVPYVWAVSLFDQHARSVRVCGGDPDWCDPHLEGRIPLMPVVCKWDLMVVLDALLRRRAAQFPVAEFVSRMRYVSGRLKAEWQRLDAEERRLSQPSEKEPKESVRRAKYTYAASFATSRSSTPRPPESARSPGRLSGPNLSWAPPASGGSTPETSAWKRQRRIAGMLVEPDVLQLIEQYRSVFREMFNVYVSEDPDGDDFGGGAMTFVALLQFCQDFRIVPRLASRHEVLRAYRCVECLEGSGIAEAGAFLEDADEPSTSLRGSSRLWLEEEAPEQSGRDSPSSQAAQLLRSVLEGEGRSRPGSAILKPSESLASLSRAHREGRGGGAGGGGGLGGGGGGVGTQLRGFGLAAFVETLCRIAFGYLLVYGNSVQITTSSRAKMAWFITYLHGVFVNLQKSHGRRLDSSNTPSPVEGAGGQRPLESSTAPSPEEGSAWRRRRPESGCADSSWECEPPTRLGDDVGGSSRGTPSVWPTPPPSAGGTSRRLARLLEKVSPDAFSQPEPPPLQRATSPLAESRAASPPGEDLPDWLDSLQKARPGGGGGAESWRRGSTMVQAKRAPLPTPGRVGANPKAGARAGTVEFSKNQARAMSVFVPDQSARSSSFRAQKRPKPKDGTAAAQQHREEEEGEAPPRDAFLFNDLLFARLMRSSVAALESEATSNYATGRSLITARPSSPSKGTGGRRLVSLEAERSALARDLDNSAGSLDRCSLTPPPLNPFALQLNERVARMMALSPG